MSTSRSQHIRALPTIALVGRVNVGKSTLFNTLIEEQQAIVSNVAGTTRTSNEGILYWRGREFRVIDTGGLTFEDDVLFEDDILAQSKKAMKVADLVLFVTDAQTGVMPQEKELAQWLRRLVHQNILLIANKADKQKIVEQLTAPEWYKLGLGEPFPISAVSGRNVGDLLDKIAELLPEEKEDGEEAEEVAESLPTDDIIQVSLIGKPNVGKSSLFNKIIGEEKVIVSDMAHTTREPHDTLVEYTQKQGEEDKTHLINFIDTAGIRRKSKVRGILERVGIHKSIQSMEKSDIILFVLDGSAEITNQDMQLGGLLERHNKSVIIILNKWDLAPDNSDEAQRKAIAHIRSYFPHLDFADIILVSGKTGFAVHKIFPKILRVAQARNTTIANRALESFLEYVTKKHKPSRGKGTRHPKLLGMRQLHAAPPIFELFVKHRTSLHRSYIKFLENRLREQFDFSGTPIVIRLTKVKRR